MMKPAPMHWSWQKKKVIRSFIRLMTRRLQPDRNDRHGDHQGTAAGRLYPRAIGGGGLAIGVSTLAKMLNPNSA